MKFIIKRLTKKDYPNWEKYILSSETSLLYFSIKYMLLLEKFLSLENFYIIAKNERGDIVGGIPIFIKENEKGAVINSLPFYGSNGGIIEFNNNVEVRNQLYIAYQELISKKKVLTSTLISNPLKETARFYEDNVKHYFIDKRIGQITKFPSGDQKNEKGLMDIFHYKTRNIVRKSLKSDIRIQSEVNDSVFRFLKDVHKENMEAIGGMSKPEFFFSCIAETFKKNEDYKIYTAYLGDVKIASVLLFYYNETVEYFTPVIKSEYRNLQPLSGLIYYGMLDAMKQGYSNWNWGGTWLSQEGVYRFKKRWGTEDREYYYYTDVHDESILNWSKENLLKEFPYFFVLPFDKLKIPK